MAFPRHFFLQNVLQFHQQRWVILCFECLAPWKIINREDDVLISKIRGENFPSGFFGGWGWGGVIRYAVTPLIVSLSPGHSDITRFHPWSPIAPDRKSIGSRLTKSSKICSDDWQRWRFWSAFRNFGTHFTESFHMSKSSWMIDPTRSREMPSCSA